jgi:3-oxoacyl-[acyl-carrier protein] reductase
MSKIALVTGASRGIGAGCAMALAREGFQLAIHFRRDRATAVALQKEIPGSELFQFDLSEPDQCEQLIKDVKASMGGIDVLVNNAGMSIDQMVTFAKPQDFQQLIQTNLQPVFMLSKLASKLMIKKKFGRIINISSIVGHTGNGGQSMYAATKGAITSFTQSIAVDLASFNILCNCVAPGFISTEMTDGLPNEVQERILSSIPLGRLGRPDEIGEAVAFLASDRASYITGTTIHVNGGMFRN